MKHTPGPWTVMKRDSCGDNVFSLAKAGAILRIANVYGGCSYDDCDCCVSEFEANALLIASAPDLLEACKEASELFKEESMSSLELAAMHGDGYERPTADDYRRVIEKLEAAISKATGGKGNE